MPCPVADLDEELIPHCPEKPLDLASSLWLPGPGVDQFYAQDGAAAQQPRIDKRRAVVQVLCPAGLCDRQRQRPAVAARGEVVPPPLVT